MVKFIQHNLKRLFSGPFWFVILVYYSFAWTITAPPYNNTAIYNSAKTIASYSQIINSISLFTFFLFCVYHFREEFSNEKKELLLTRLTHKKIVWGIAVSYILFFMLGFVLPAYIVGFVQQLCYAPDKIDFAIYPVSFFSHLFGYYFFWLVVVFLLFVAFRNEFSMLIVMFIFYGITFLISLISKGKFFNNMWVSDVLFGHYNLGVISVLFWLVLTCGTIIITNRFAVGFLERDISEKYKKGLFVRILEKAKMYLSMHHLSMMGLGSQKILTVFSVVGLVYVISALKTENANLLPFAKIYVGAFLPLLFSFNQYFIIGIDKEAGMSHNNSLRKLSYPRIILNRWLVLLIPQLILAFIFSMILALSSDSISPDFIPYVILINILCSILNLCVGIVTNRSGISNLLLLFLVYIQLNDKFQKSIGSNSFLDLINIFKPLVSLNSTSIGTSLLLLLAIVNGLLVLFAYWRLGKVK